MLASTATLRLGFASRFQSITERYQPSNNNWIHESPFELRNVGRTWLNLGDAATVHRSNIAQPRTWSADAEGSNVLAMEKETTNSNTVTPQLATTGTAATPAKANAQASRL